jgi:AraC-like DNA-binding protein
MLAMATEARGLAPSRIFASSGIDPTVLERRGARVALAPVSRAWDQIVQRLDDPLFGLQLVDMVPFGAGDLLDYLVRSSATIGQALEQLVRYAPLMNDADRFTLEVSGHQARMRFHTTGNRPYNREMLFGLFARRSRELYGQAWSLDRVSLTHGPLGPKAAYDRLLQAPVHFGMPVDEAVFSRDLLAQPMPGADQRLHAILKVQAEGLLATLSPRAPAPSFIETVEQALVSGLAQGDVTLTRLSDHLGLSARTIQRRLRDLGVSHRGLVRQLRHELAARSLGAPLSQGQIARSLGYSGAASFHRAFKSWSGMTPGQVRARKPPRGLHQ